MNAADSSARTRCPDCAGDGFHVSGWRRLPCDVDGIGVKGTAVQVAEPVQGMRWHRVRIGGVTGSWTARRGDLRCKCPRLGRSLEGATLTTAAHAAARWQDPQAAAV